MPSIRRKTFLRSGRSTSKSTRTSSRPRSDGSRRLSEPQSRPH
jgi:hypothetical protein